MAQKLLEIFAWLSGGIMIVQVCTLRLCVLLMMPGGRRMGPAHESLSFFMYDDEVEELLHVDLARTPPETERPSPELQCTRRARGSSTAPPPAPPPG